MTKLLRAVCQANAVRRGELPPATAAPSPASCTSKNAEIQRLKASVATWKQRAHENQRKYHTLKQRHDRLWKADQRRKAQLKLMKVDFRQMERTLKKSADELMRERAGSEGEFRQLRDVIVKLKNTKMSLWKALRKTKHRASRLAKALAAKCKQLRELSKTKPNTIQLVKKGVYTREARALARHLVSTGVAEKKMLGVKVKGDMDRRTVQRAILEGGVASDIQLAYEIMKADKLTFSSDSTSHKHIKYKSCCIALEVIDYNDPSSEPHWTTRTLGVDTTVNHTSEEQIKGLRARLELIARIFNNSPFAQRTGMCFSPDELIYRM
ncbi:hypothetical protein BKA70DRAFT_1373176 [Coprinopsis sp. MPI-PUGE-AT-0042]|nr:hypothetical protein BKA70DRAFT_1373176 [Coprinopsis sp. MPI-PUGE-AT-0042]